MRPYFALRSYQDDREHYDGQIGSEPTPAAFLEALWAVTAECRRVLKPSGSMFVNLGDKYSGAGPQNAKGARSSVGNSDQWQQVKHGRSKSLMGLPWRYAIGCIDQLDLILRAEVIWSKPNGLPESVTDRVRRSHEQWFHFTKEPRYYSAVDEIRESYHPSTFDRHKYGYKYTTQNRSSSLAADGHMNQGPLRSDIEAGHTPNPLGKLPGSVWTIPTEPLRVPDHLPQHFAAFPSEWPRRIILGWSPSGVCVECGEGRRPEVEQTSDDYAAARAAVKLGTPRDQMMGGGRSTGAAASAISNGLVRSEPAITGYSCACPTPDAPTRPAIVLDPFAGTGTTVAVANHLGRYGIGVDLSADYLRLARWRIHDPALRAKVLRVDKPPEQIDGQGVLL